MCLAVPGLIVEVVEGSDPALRQAKVDFAGIRKQVSLAFTPEAGAGDWVMVHVGFALNTINAREAGRIQELLRQLDDAAARLEPGTE